LKKRINSDDSKVVLSAVQDIVKLLSIVTVFNTPGERFQIASHVFRVFDLVEKSYSLGRMITILNTWEDPYIIYECLKAITLLAPGPRIANTPEDSLMHPKKFYYKALLAKEGIIPLLLKMTTVKWLEVKRQAILALGMLIQSCIDVRDVVVGLDGINILINLIYEDIDIDTGKAIAWTLSLLAGVTIKGQSSTLDQSHVIALVKIFTWFLYWKDDTDTLAHSLLGLSYLLPLVELTLENKDVWERAVSMLTHNAIFVKRASLNCLKSIARSNDMQCQFIIERNAVGLTSDLLNYNNTQVKTEACEFIYILARQGYTNVSVHNIISDFLGYCSKSKLHYQYDQNDLRRVPAKKRSHQGL